MATSVSRAKVYKKVSYLCQLERSLRNLVADIFSHVLALAELAQEVAILRKSTEETSALTNGSKRQRVL